MKITALTLATTFLFPLLDAHCQSDQAAGDPAGASDIPKASPVKPEDKKLAPGEFAWHPERSAEGPLLVVCSIDDQMLYAYRNGIEIARSTVVITSKKTTPSKSVTPATILKKSEAANPADKSGPKGKVVWEPKKSPHGPISILLSYTDKTVYVWRNGVQIGQSPVEFNTEIESLPEGVFLMLDGEEPADAKLPGITIHPWSTLSLSGGEVDGDIIKFMRETFSLPPEFRAALNKELHPGTILLATQDSSTAETRSGPMAIGVTDEVPEGEE